MQQNANDNYYIQNMVNNQQDETNHEFYKIQNTRIDFMERFKSRAFPLLNLFCFTIKIFVNTLAESTTLIGGTNYKLITHKHPTLLTPDGFVFSIWAIIHTFNAAFIIFQLPYVITGWKNHLIFDQIGLLYAVACFTNILWIFLLNFDQRIASFLIISIFLIVTLLIYIRLKIGYGESDRNRVVNEDRKIQWWEFLIVQPTFSFYLSWLTVATISNSFHAGFTDPFGIGQENYAAMMITLTTVISMIFLHWRRDFIYSGVVCWAVFAIYNQQNSKNKVFAMAALINSSLVGVATFSVIIYEAIL
jgi:translocator protein